MKLKNWKTSVLIVLALTLLTAALAPNAHAAGQRLRAIVEEPFEIQGEVHAPNVLTVRQVGEYTPNSVFAEVWVGKECLGRLIAQDNAEGAISDVDSLVFSRNDAGRLVLVGVNFRGESERSLTAFGHEMTIASSGSLAMDDSAAMAAVRP